MNRRLTVLFVCLFSNIGFAQYKNTNQWFLKANNVFSFINEKIYQYNNLIPQKLISSTKGADYSFQPSLMRITRKKNISEYGLSARVNNSNTKFDSSWGKLRSNNVLIDSTSTIAGINSKIYTLSISNSFEYNFLKSASKVKYLTIGIKNEIEYNFIKMNPHITNSFNRRVNQLILTAGIVHRGGIGLNKNIILEYSIPFSLINVGILKQFNDNPQIPTKHQHLTNFILNTPYIFSIPQQIAVSIGCLF